MSQCINHKNLMLFESYCLKNQVDGKTISAKVAGKNLKLKVASTPASQMQGYMNAAAPPTEGEGMLFVYDLEQSLSFWMKQVSFPLDIIFFDANRKYVSHKTMPTAFNLPDSEIPQYFSEKPAQFAVEVPAGWCERNLTSSCRLDF